MNQTAPTHDTTKAGNAVPDKPIARINDLAVSFDNGRGPRVQAVDGVRMTIYPRQTLAVVGESGCGKSVTAMSMLQLIPRPPGRFDRGEIIFETERGPVNLLTLNSREMRQIRGNDIAMIFQEPMTSLNPVYTIGDQIMEAILLHQDVSHSQARDIAVNAMRDVGIPDPEQRIKAYPHQFSGGMRQRVMIAMALACQPKLLLADEPSTALDVTIQAQILELITDLKHTRDMAVMLITHDLGVVAENSDVVCVMYAGRVVEYAKVFDLYDKPMHPYTRGLLASIPKMHARHDRLITIREIVEDEAQFKMLPGAEEGVRPWWPWHDAPADLAAQSGPAGDYYLQEVSPEHWVGVWRTEAVRDHESRAPDIDFRIPPKDRPELETA
ncbi:Oligopeptide transport ATP-binding protein OppD (TC 3.A.1.5.1) [hydrothermal vent metagenome]|uniref:Oligopeptide transport ATP-binding protein OppD (TC 3.A.1.5.1) n=1 Tax=hydrothermal vent metagenome TaxID=652676 RepID=A0A3B1DN97_9ZZZZ